jgi:hypothetical protein
MISFCLSLTIAAIDTNHEYGALVLKDLVFVLAIRLFFRNFQIMDGLNDQRMYLLIKSVVTTVANSSFKLANAVS